jgi:predicted DNA-binding ribbon-helix-helix protein
VPAYKTSVSVAEDFWILSVLVGMIDAERQHGNLSSAIRLFVLAFYRDQVSSTPQAQIVV